jgi:two-component system LytT family response regulator
MKIRTLIVDDVELARERVKMLLGDEEIEIVGEASSGLDAVEAIIDLKPDLVFLDIQMPEMDGFEVVESVGVEQMPATVFVTAYDKFALRAFDANAVDYLVKPFDKERLTKAVERVKREIERRTPGDFRKRLELLLKEIQPEPKYLKRIPVKSARGIILLPVEEISWINSAGHYVKLHTAAGDTHLVRRQITQLEKKLDPEEFVRVHRSNIVNIDRIKSLHPLFNGDHLIIMHNGEEINMSRTYHEKLMTLLDR